MLAMRAGQPCLVHSVGGLSDTVKNDVNGFSFDGNSLTQQAANLLIRVSEVKLLVQDDTKKYKTISQNAQNARFLWEDSAASYMSSLYQF